MEQTNDIVFIKEGVVYLAVEPTDAHSPCDSCDLLGTGYCVDVYCTPDETGRGQLVYQNAHTDFTTMRFVVTPKKPKAQR